MEKKKEYGSLPMFPESIFVRNDYACICRFRMVLKIYHS